MTSSFLFYLIIVISPFFKRMNGIKVMSGMDISWTFSKAMLWKLIQPFYLPSGSSLLTCKFCHGPSNLNGCSQPLYSSWQEGSLECSGLEKRKRKMEQIMFSTRTDAIIVNLGIFFLCTDFSFPFPSFLYN